MGKYFLSLCVSVVKDMGQYFLSLYQWSQIWHGTVPDSVLFVPWSVLSVPRSVLFAPGSVLFAPGSVRFVPGSVLFAPWVGTFCPWVSNFCPWIYQWSWSTTLMVSSCTTSPTRHNTASTDRQMMGSRRRPRR